MSEWGLRETIKTLTFARSLVRSIVRASQLGSACTKSGKLIPRPLSSCQRGAAEPNLMGFFNCEKKLMHSTSSSLGSVRRHGAVACPRPSVLPARPFSRAPQFEPVTPARREFRFVAVVARLQGASVHPILCSLNKAAARPFAHSDDAPALRPGLNIPLRVHRA